MPTVPSARLGLLRLGRSRLGDSPPPPVEILINGAAERTRIAGLRITDELNHAPNTASLRADGFTPIPGQTLTIDHGGVRYFAGHLLAVDQVYEAETPSRVAWDCHGIDYTWLLTRRPVIKKYQSASATAIVLDLMASFSSGFTVAHVEAGMPVLDEITFTNEDLPDALSRVMERVGGYWYVDYDKDLHAFLTETETAAPITQAVPRSMRDIKQHVDISQIATRVTARGGGSVTAADVAVGATSIPVDDSSWYDPAGGIVEAGPQRITYTGVQGAGETGSTTGSLAPPILAGPLVTNTVGSLVNGTYQVAVTYVTAGGETTPSAVFSLTLAGANDGMDLFGIPVPTDPAITDRRLYITDVGGSVLKFKTALGLAATFATILTAGGTTVAPTANTTNAATVPAGSTTLLVDDLAMFAASGWAVAPGGQLFYYSGRSASSGPGTLIGIPATGVGSLTAPVQGGTVKTIPHLTGVAGVVYALPKGEQVNLVVTVDDAAAQTAMAAYVGSGDGIHEMFLSDGRWGRTEATARATTELTQRKDPLVTITFFSRDRSLVSGRSVTITLTSPAITGTFKIQRVTFSEIGVSANAWPLRFVECSSRQYSFEDLLRRLQAT